MCYKVSVVRSRSLLLNWDNHLQGICFVFSSIFCSKNTECLNLCLQHFGIKVVKAFLRYYILQQTEHLRHNHLVEYTDVDNSYNISSQY